MSDSLLLPPKEAGSFKQIVRCYEMKQYKKGLKTADGILKKFPNHGETLAMKGLIINASSDNLGGGGGGGGAASSLASVEAKKAEAYDLVRLGLKHDLKSHVCWHVYGLLYRSDRNYNQAIKCYLNALRQDPENTNILRDLSMLQIQMRDIKGYAETRQKLFGIRTNSRFNWISFAIGQHLNGNHEMAVEVLNAYHTTLDTSGPNGGPRFSSDLEKYEHGELLLYRAMVLEEGNLFDEALAHLDTCEPLAVDHVGLKEQRARLLLKAGRNAEAEEMYQILVEFQPESHSYHDGLRASMGLPPSTRPDANGGAATSSTPEQIERMTALYAELRDEHPKCSAVQRIPLDFLPVGTQFKTRLLAYVRRRLTRGIPSLFSDLKGLYVHAAKAAVIEALFLEIEESLKKSELFPEASADDMREAPSTLLWTYIYLAQHFDRTNDTPRALAYADAALKHTPTVIDLYLVKAKILKHAGDPVSSALLADMARSMDLADRYLNTICVKKLLRAGHQKQAENTIMLFTRGTGPDDSKHKTAEELSRATQRNLYDMQCSWYEIECGACHERQGELGKALKKYVAVTKHYADITEDQFDFHTYCVRKMTLRSYVEMLRMEDRLHGEKAYRRGASGAIRVYIKLHDKKPSGAGGAGVLGAVVRPHARAADIAGRNADGAPLDPDDPNLTPAERKRIKQKLRKAEAKAASKEEKAASKDGTPSTKDDDPDGAQLASTDNPLGEATKIVSMLQQHAPSHVETHLLAFEVYMRSGKAILALQAAKQAVRLSPESPAAHRNVCAMFVACERLFAQWDAEKPAEGEKPAVAAARAAQRGTVREVYALERDEMLPKGTGMLDRLEAYNASYLEAHGTLSLAQRSAAGEVLHRLHTPTDWGAAPLTGASRSDSARARGVELMCSADASSSLADRLDALDTLRGVLGTADAHVSSFLSASLQAFPYARCFGGSYELPEEQRPSSTDA
ncbi:N-terminal acetyltransferase A complex auxiliary subunit NAA15 [Pseudoscourfieldia marina]